MAMVVWVMMGIAVWHFTVFLPDRFAGGIVGAFMAAFVGAVIVGFLANGLTVPGQSDTDIVQALIAIPGAVIGLAISYWYGARMDRASGIDHGQTRVGRTSFRRPRERVAARRRTQACGAPSAPVPTRPGGVRPRS